MKRLYTLYIYMFCAILTCVAQQNHVYRDDIKSLQLVVDDNPLSPAIVEKGNAWNIVIGFDQMSHEYHRFIYHIDLCNADWSVNEEVFESDFLTGLNDQPIEDYEKSFNTTQLYTHYRLSLPNDDVRLRLSGNYRVTITEDDCEDEGPVLTAEFCLAEPKMSLSVQETSNTDIDFNGSNQQLTYALSYGSVRVDDPTRELHTVVMQNRRQDCQRIDLEPNYIKATGIEFVHNRGLIFPAGNEYHKFEFLSVHRASLNIDHIRWYDPYYYVTVYEDRQARNYSYDEDQNGGFWLRNEDDEDNETTSEYAWVNFTLQTEEKLEGDVYVCGDWCNGATDPKALMTYNEKEGTYEASIYMKQGYYNYQYRLLPPNGEQTTTIGTDGNFYETRNEYIILVYHRPTGGRTDNLVAYRVFTTE